MEDYRKNLKKLADYLWVLPQDYKSFGMKYFMECPYSRLNGSFARKVGCGCVACAVGHGPTAGIPALCGEGWFDYQRRVFGLTTEDDEDQSFAWSWMFSDYWSAVDNTAKGAAKRIYYYLENGVPDNWEEQMDVDGEAPLCYLSQGKIDG